MGQFIAGLFTVGLIVLMAFLFLGGVSARFDLIQPAFWWYVSGIVFFLGGSLIAASGGGGIGGFFATMGIMALAVGGYKTMWPNTAKATAAAQEIADIRVAMGIGSLIAGDEIPCDRTTTSFWSEISGDPVIFYAFDKEARRIRCRNWRFWDSLSGVRYKPVRSEIVDVIRSQEPDPLLPAPSVRPETAEEADRILADKIIEESYGSQLHCGEVTNLPFPNLSGRVFYNINETTKRVECFDHPGGYNGMKKHLPITENIIRLIRLQEPATTPVETLEEEPQPVPSPVPVMSEGTLEGPSV